LKSRFDLVIDLRKRPETRHILQLSVENYLVGFGHQKRFPWPDIALEWQADKPLIPKRQHVFADLIGLANAVSESSEPTSSAMFRFDSEPKLPKKLGPLSSGVWLRTILARATN
jgi:hypothetical protein